MRIKRTLATLALASTLALTGCSDDGGDDNDANSSDETSETPTATEEPTDEETDEVEGDEVDIDEFLADFAEGVDATTSARMAMDMDVSGQTIEITGDVDYTTQPPNMVMFMSGGALSAEDIEMRIVDGVVYMNLGSTSQNKFLEMSLEDLGAQAGLGNLTDQLDPGAQLESFRDGLTEVTFVGEEDIEGVDDAERYHLVLDTTKLENTPAGSPEELEIDIWLDDENRVAQTASDFGGGSITVRIFDFGTDVDVEKPPASEIQQMPGA